ncbi:Xylanase inhibitor, N-terminal [Dillenia turbinata]|uniref:Xylanase inhibitor, N-terminal n=1 Tax=Dillenia turbinata TaxID=194707 RepID=A0AAN8UYE4_9MAGN
MRLLDELIINGYYTTRVRIGTPPQEFALIVDTGSTITYVPCSTRSHCGRHQKMVAATPISIDCGSHHHVASRVICFSVMVYFEK